MPSDKLLDVLNNAPELARLCTQNGWIDNDTLRYDVIERRHRSVLLAVQFEEIIMEGAGCVADRKPCYGRVRLNLAGDGTYSDIEVI
ncbi:MAG: hypothetical protein ABFS45_01235 [Pseudomonadota bacterium]